MSPTSGPFSSEPAAVFLVSGKDAVGGGGASASVPAPGTNQEKILTDTINLLKSAETAMHKLI